MTHIHQLTFGPFAENTYILSDDYSNAIIIDPGMYYPQENIKFFEYLNRRPFILEKELTKWKKNT